MAEDRAAELIERNRALLAYAKEVRELAAATAVQAHNRLLSAKAMLTRGAALQQRTLRRPPDS